MAKKYKIEKFGPTTKRRSYSNTINNLPVSDYISILKKSFDWFLKEGIKEVFQNIYPITSTNGRIQIKFLSTTLRIESSDDQWKEIKEAKIKGKTFSAKIYATLRKIDGDTGEAKDQEVFFGEIPMMTDGASFVVNGSEKVIISQLLRAPGAYYGLNVRTARTGLYNRVEVIPRLGIWIDMYHKVDNPSYIDWVKVSIDKNKPFSISVFLRSFGITKTSIKSLFGNLDLINESINKDNKKTEDDALEFVHGILRKGDRITEDSKKNLFSNLLFNKRRYDLSKTGRFMINRKLSIIERITDTILAKDLVSENGDVIFKANTFIDKKIAHDIHDAFVKELLPMENIPDVSPEILYGNQIKPKEGKKITKSQRELKSRIKIIKVEVYPNETWKNENKNLIVIGNDPNASEQHLVMPDLIAIISYYFNIENGIGSEDDPDSLINKKVVSIGELLQNQLQIALTKLERNAKERMSAREAQKITPKNVTNNKFIYDQFKVFFNTSQLSQFMDQMNPLAEIANKRRVTTLGPGGLNRETAKHEVRDVHITHYGRICPIETPEGQNIGLILNFANYARINQYGFIETPYFKIENGKVINQPIYKTAFEEIGMYFAQSSINIDEDGKILDKKVTARIDGEYKIIPVSELNYLEVSSKQMTSIASAAIPFLENDDANRALMGANMQRQAVPLLKSESPIVATGVEADIAKFASSNLKSLKDGTVSYVDANVIEIKQPSKRKKIYKLRTFERSNQNSLITQKPLVNIGQKIKEGDILADGPSFDKGELALGKNVIVAFSTWNGYNFEDAIVVSEKLVRNDVFTSIHIDEKIIEFRKQKLGDDELTPEIPNLSKFSLRNLDSEGIVRVGSEVQSGDVLVGKVSPKGEENPSPEEKLIAAIFSKKTKNLRDTSLKVSHGNSGTVIDVQKLSRKNGDKLQDDVHMIIKVLIAQKRKIKVGDKMAGRHGNKGVISRILPIEDMPHLADGTPVDILLNPQGVPSRMNLGQVLELHLGIAGKKLKTKFATPVFDGITVDNIQDIFKEANLPKDGKFDLYDPISGEKFDSKISVGIMYMLKLSHMIDDKMHARSVGPYSLITQQPLGGKSQNGGQRFGEMETWAIEAFGATNVLQELLTYKSDNIEGRNKVYNSLVNGVSLPTPGTPESFNVLAYELRGLGMKLAVGLNKDLKEEGNE